MLTIHFLPIVKMTFRNCSLYLAQKETDGCSLSVEKRRDIWYFITESVTPYIFRRLGADSGKVQVPGSMGQRGNKLSIRI